MSSPAKKGKEPFPGVLSGIIDKDNPKKIPIDMVLTHIDNSGRMTPRSVFRRDIHMKMRADLMERFAKIIDALGNPQHQHYENIVNVGRTWFGDKVERNDLKDWTSTMKENLPRLSISINNFVGNHRGQTPGRLTGKFDKFPGLAIERNTKNKPIPPGIDINARYMPQKIDDKSNYENIMWTYVHEASHAILSTTDYSYVNTRETIPVFTKKGHNSLPTVMTHNDYEIKKKNADHHAGFFMNASRLLNSPVQGNTENSGRTTAASSSHTPSRSTSSPRQAPTSFPLIAPSQRPSPTQRTSARLPPITPGTGGTATGTSSPATSRSTSPPRQASTSFPPIASAQNRGATAPVNSFGNSSTKGNQR